MTSGKKCLKCKLQLTRFNWKKHDQKSGHYICQECRKEYDRKRHHRDLKYGKKQRNRYRERRSAVIFHYGNECTKCSEDDYTKLSVSSVQGGRVDINYLYNNLIDKNGYQVYCYNCLAIKPKNKYTLRKIELYGGCCSECKEDHTERLVLVGTVVLCLNCNHSRIAAEELALITLQALEH
jgi:hypothetical protein